MAETYYAVVDRNGRRLRITLTKEGAQRHLRKWEDAHDIEELDHDPRLTDGGEQSDETTDGDETPSTMNYTFLTDGTDTTNNSDDGFTPIGSRWSVGDHSTVTDGEAETVRDMVAAANDSLDDELDADLLGVLEDAAGLVEDTSISSFECPVCGLHHSHSDVKHDIRSAFDVTPEFAEQIDFNPICHCGVNELSMLMRYAPGFSGQMSMFEDQDEFAGVFELPVGLVDDLYRRREDGIAVAASEVCENSAVDASLVVEMAGQLRMFFERRESIDNAASSAPIPTDTRQEIDQRGNELEGRFL